MTKPSFLLLAGVLIAGASLAGPEAARAAEGAATAGRIRGAVTGPDKRPLAGRLVMLRATGGSGELRVTSTDEKGQYQFRELPTGTYELRVEADGYETSVKPGIDVKPPFQNVVDMPMRAAGGAAPPGPGTLAAHAAAATAARGAAPTGAAAAVPPAPTAAPVDAPAGDVAPVVVQGLLRDKEGAPVLEASILALPIGGVAIYQGRSDREGKFRIEAVPPGTYRVLVRSPGHVIIDLSRVEVPAVSGLNLRLVLADYPINFKAGPDTTLPPEKPRPFPPTAPAAPPAVVPAPEPEEGPQVPQPAEPS